VAAVNSSKRVMMAKFKKTVISRKNDADQQFLQKLGRIIDN
jgi:hypothetical protein